jgi:hypothetical protein
MPRELRPRYKEVMNNFYNKYENQFMNENASPADKTPIKQKDIKKRIDEIAQRRSELKKIAKKNQIDRKLQDGKDENSDHKEDTEADIPDQT